MVAQFYWCPALRRLASLIVLVLFGDAEPVTVLFSLFSILFLLHWIIYFTKIFLSKVHNRRSSSCLNVHVSLPYNRTGLSGVLCIA